MRSEGTEERRDRRTKERKNERTEELKNRGVWEPNSYLPNTEFRIPITDNLRTEEQKN